MQGLWIAHDGYGGRRLLSRESKRTAGHSLFLEVNLYVGFALTDGCENEDAVSIVFVAGAVVGSWMTLEEIGMPIIWQIKAALS